MLCMQGKTIVLFPDTPFLKILQNISSGGASSIWAWGLFVAQLLEISTVCSPGGRSGALLMQCFHHETHSVPLSSSEVQC